MRTDSRVEPQAPPAALSLDGGPPSSPVKLWAVLGAIGLTVALTGWASWLLFGDPTPAPKGSDGFPTWNLVYLRALEFIAITGVLGVFWHFVVRPWRRDGALSFDGMLILAMMTLWFYDPMCNYWNVSQVYNSHFINFGSWANYIPGWNYPGFEKFPEPVLFIGSAYVWWTFGGVMICTWVLKQMKRRYPTWSTLALWGALGAVLCVVDVLVEILFIRTEAWVYSGVPQGWFTLWSGTQYQFPLWEPFVVFLWVGGMTALRQFRDDRGFTFVERGAERLAVGLRARKRIQFLSLVGFLHVWFLVSYFVPYSWLISLRADTAPAVPSYLRNELCGAGTPRACPSQYVPIPGHDSIPIAPDDPRLPESVRSRQG